MNLDPLTITYERGLQILFSKRVSGSIRKKVGKLINFNPLTITYERGLKFF